METAAGLSGHEPARTRRDAARVHAQVGIPCAFMRGGTSRGPFFLREDLPRDDALMKQVLLRVMGSPHSRQIDGIGGADPVTSKVAMVRRSARSDADVDYLFAQVFVERALVDTSPPCGNMVTAVGPFAIERGLVAARDGETVVRIWDVNTQSLIEATVQTPGGEVTYDGDLLIAGVNDPASPVILNLARMAGAKTGTLFPTGSRSEEIDGVTVSCVDMAMPCMFVAAASLGRTGYETKEELDADHPLIERLQALRVVAGERMGLGDVRDAVIPKPVLVAAPRDGGTVSGRYFMPFKVAPAFAVTGGTNMAVSSCIPGTVVHAFSRHAGTEPERDIAVEHPAGKMFVRVALDHAGDEIRVREASQIRHCRKLFEGEVLVPASVWPVGDDGHRA